MTTYVVVSGDDLMPHYTDSYETLEAAIQATSAGDYVLALEDGSPRMLSQSEEATASKLRN